MPNREYSRTKRLNILIVDDDQQSSKLFKELLETRGHNVSSISDEGQCISTCLKNNKNNFDVIFLDYHLESINGVELADIIKDSFKSSSIMFAYTGDFSNDALNKFKNIGMNGVIIKPINPELINQVMGHIEQNGNIDSVFVKRIAKTNQDSLIFF